jgi:undecaprenyl-diphosphatase
MKFLSEATNYPPVKVILSLLLVGMLYRNQATRSTVVLALIAVGVANSFTEVFKHAWPMHRPFQDFPDGVIMWVGKTENFGTASAHAANMAAVAYVFVRMLKLWGIPWVVIALLVGLSRIFCGAHYPYQVALGWTCGVIAAWITTSAWDQWKARRSTPEASPTKPEPSA